jgi:peptidoglycan/LPS O-acetylase OafA/YrhL
MIKNKTEIDYLPHVDGLRALSILLVIGFHAFPHILSGGFIGVDVFFVISGYLISKIIIKTIDKKKFSILTFYSKRIKRIFPSLILVLIFCSVFGWFALFSDEYKNLGKDIFFASIFLSNYILLQESGYFDTSAFAKPLLHIWSLSIEEQFYIFWPLILYFFYKKKNFFYIIIFIIILFFIINIVYSYVDPVLNFYSPITRCWELLIGFLLAIYLNKKNYINDKKYSLDLIGLFILLASAFLIDKDFRYPHFWALLPIVGASLILISNKTSFINKIFLSNRLMVGIGLISYPLYLWHWSLLSFANIIQVSADGTLIQKKAKIIIIIFSIIISYLTYIIIEKPIRYGTYKNNFLKTSLLILIMFVIGLIGYLIFKNEGYPSRGYIKEEDTILFQDYPHKPYNNVNCKERLEQFKYFNTCLLSKNKDPQIAIIGDSHSHQYYKSFSEKLNDKSIINISVFHCLPFSNEVLTNKNKCNFLSKKVFEYIANTDSINTVILAGNFSYLASGEFEYNGNARIAKTATSEQITEFKLNAYKNISKISSKKNIILILDTPEFFFHPKECAIVKGYPIRNLYKKTPRECSVDNKEFYKKNHDYEIVFREILKNKKNVKIFNPKSVFCDQSKCYLKKGNEFLYYDSDHLSRIGADSVVNGILKENIYLFKQ